MHTCAPTHTHTHTHTHTRTAHARCTRAGHYELNLALPAHAAIAARLKDESLSGPEGPSWVNLLFDAARCVFCAAELGAVDACACV
jgi:hypothetical protein